MYEKWQYVLCFFLGLIPVIVVENNDTLVFAQHSPIDFLQHFLYATHIQSDSPSDLQHTYLLLRVAEGNWHMSTASLPAPTT